MGHGCYIGAYRGYLIGLHLPSNTAYVVQGTIAFGGSCDDTLCSCGKERLHLTCVSVCAQL